MIRHLVGPAIDLAEHDRTADVVTAAGLIAATYATPARLRPALGIVVAVGLSRIHGAGVQRMRRDVLALLTDGRAQVTPRVDRLERILRDVEAGVAAPWLVEPGHLRTDPSVGRIIGRATATDADWVELDAPELER